jgi:hypothetical protein
MAGVRKTMKKECGKNFPRKLETWRENNRDLISFLVFSALYPVNRLRLESNFAEILIEELPDNFRVVSVKAKHVTQLTKEQISVFEQAKGSFTKENIVCVVAFQINAINENSVGNMRSFYGGKYKALHIVQQWALLYRTQHEVNLEKLNSRPNIKDY